ncbi:MAG: phosphoribosyl-AMP cyclohydrolase [Rhodobacteraceae bacterium]|nr:phosphoribosyl-AMP cyclohydrolase [Paracoccaceae bacterium]
MKRTEACDGIDRLRFNSDGLIPVIVQDSEAEEILMMAWMNREALSRTMATGRMTYWSRSRKCLWIKGETSGNTQHLLELRTDCDQDCLLARIEQTGNACHTGRRSCFFEILTAADSSKD